MLQKYFYVPLGIVAWLACSSCDAQNTYDYVTPPAFECSLYDSATESQLYPIWKDGKYGYMNGKGEVVVEMTLDWATKFYDGTGIIRFEDKAAMLGKMALIDSKGKIICKDHEGMEVDVGSNSKYGLHGIRCYRKGEHLHGFVNRKGELVIPLFFNKANSFQNGFAAVAVHDPRITKGDNIWSGTVEEKNRQRWGFINTKGELVIPFLYNDVNDFSEGLAPVSNGVYTGKSDYEGKWGYIDTTGKIVIEMKYEYAGAFHEGLAPVRIDGKEGFIDTKGNLVIKPQFKFVDRFSNGLALACIERKDYQQLYGFIDKTGKWIIPPVYHYALDFENGMACVETKDEKYGMINTQGKWVIKPKYDGLIFFSEGIGVTELNGMSGFIDINGNSITPFIYSDAGVFENGLAYAVMDGNFYHPKPGTELSYINRKGECVWKSQY